MFCTDCGHQAESFEVCPNCGVPSELYFKNKLKETLPGEMQGNMRYMIPCGRPFSALAAGYLGLLSVIPIFAPFAILTGVLGLKAIKKDSSLTGSVRCWFGIIAGALSILICLLLLISAFVVKSN